MKGNGTNLSNDPNYSCHEPYESHSDMVASVQFWLEGIGVLIMGSFGKTYFYNLRLPKLMKRTHFYYAGIVGNLITIIILRRIDSNVSFNRLLMTLGKN